MGVLGTIKRVAVVGALAAGLMYAGDAMNIHGNVIDPIFNNKPVEAGYTNPRNLAIEKKVNLGGNIETYLVYSENDQQQKLPVFKNGGGMQVGSSDYWWGNITLEERNSFVVTGWKDLEPVQKTQLTLAGWEQLSNKDRGALVSKDWATLEDSTKYAIVKGDLERALDSFYKQAAGGE